MVNIAIPLELMQLTGGKRPKEEVAKVIDDLFEGWENLTRLRVIFTEILISVALNVPPMFDIGAGKTFGGTLKSLLSVGIVLLRDFVYSLPPMLVAKVMTALMGTLSYKEGEVCIIGGDDFGGCIGCRPVHGSRPLSSLAIMLFQAAFVVS